MRQVHRAGDKAFIDFAGTKPHVVDPRTREVVEVELFVAVLGASSFTYATAVPSQSGPHFIRAHVQAFEYFGGVPRAIVPDQLKAGVQIPCRYEPKIQRSYEDMARHYGTAAFPARPKKPKDKSLVEVGVQVATRWILARLRNHTLFSIEALNQRIGELLEELNDREMKRYKKSRRQRFEEIDRPALECLPARPFEYGEWKKARVNIDYHIDVDGHFYSVPYHLSRQFVDTRLTTTTVEIFFNHNRVTTHLRSRKRGLHTTKSEHMPKSHRAHLEWTPSRIIGWAKTVGPQTGALAEAILTSRPHPEMGYRSCLGIVRLEKKYGKEKLEAACARAIALGARSYRHVTTTLKNNLEDQPLLYRRAPRLFDELRLAKATGEYARELKKPIRDIFEATWRLWHISVGGCDWLVVADRGDCRAVLFYTQSRRCVKDWGSS